MSTRKPATLRPAHEVIEDVIKLYNLKDETLAQKTGITADTLRRFHFGPYSAYTSYPTLQKGLTSAFDLPKGFFEPGYTAKTEAPAVKEAPKAEVKTEAKPAPKTEPKAEVKPAVKEEPKTEAAAPVVEVAPVAEAVTEVKAAPAAEAVPAAPAAPAIPVTPTIVLSPDYQEAIANEIRLKVLTGGNRRVEELAKIASLIGEDKVDLLIQIAKSYLK